MSFRLRLMCSCHSYHTATLIRRPEGLMTPERFDLTLVASQHVSHEEQLSFKLPPSILTYQGTCRGTGISTVLTYSTAYSEYSRTHGIAIFTELCLETVFYLLLRFTTKLVSTSMPTYPSRHAKAFVRESPRDGIRTHITRATT